MNLGFDGLLQWVSDEGSKLILIAGIFFCIVLAFRKHLIGAISTFVVLLVAYLFVKNPNLLGTVSEFFGGKIGLN